MGKALTVRRIETVKPATSRREVADGLLSGLYLIVQPTGAKSWAVRYRFAGMPRKHTIGSYPAIDLASARELARKALVSVADGRDPAREKRTAKQGTSQADSYLVEKLIGHFLERHAKANTRASTWHETKRLFKKDVIPAWRGRPVDEITRSDVIGLLDGVVDRGAPILANRVLAATRRFFRWCIERGILTTSPCVGVTAPSAERSRDRVLSDAEVRILWKASTKIGWPFGPFVQLLALTGQRRDEVAGMRWSELDLNNRACRRPLVTSSVRRTHGRTSH